VSFEVRLVGGSVDEYSDLEVKRVWNSKTGYQIAGSGGVRWEFEVGDNQSLTVWKITVHGDVTPDGRVEVTETARERAGYYRPAQWDSVRGV
jgi:hypothetical protein